MLSVTLLGSGPLGPAQALAPQALREPPQPQPPCSRPPATPPGPISPKRAPAPHRWTEIPPLFYRTLSHSGPLPCLNFSSLKKTAQVPKMCTTGQRVSLTINGPRPSFALFLYCSCSVPLLLCSSLALFRCCSILLLLYSSIPLCHSPFLTLGTAEGVAQNNLRQLIEQQK